VTRRPKRSPRDAHPAGCRPDVGRAAGDGGRDGTVGVGEERRRPSPHPRGELAFWHRTGAGAGGARHPHPLRGRQPRPRRVSGMLPRRAKPRVGDRGGSADLRLTVWGCQGSRCPAPCALGMVGLTVVGGPGVNLERAHAVRHLPARREPQRRAWPCRYPTVRRSARPSRWTGSACPVPSRRSRRRGRKSRWAGPGGRGRRR